MIYPMEESCHECTEKSLDKTFPSPATDELIGKTPWAVRRAVLELLETPPVITEREPDESEVLEKIRITAETSDNTADAAPKPTDVTLFIPLGGGIAPLLVKSGCADVDALLEKIKTLAAKENLGCLWGLDDEEHGLIVNLHKLSGGDYSKPMDPKDLEFLCLFDRELF